MNDRSPFAIRNIRLFIAFRIFFNARFYYPVFTILFLDYGLTIEQFSILNTVWAVTIVGAEIPSGALADLLGRKRLLIFTSWLMIVEMSVIAFVPLGSMTVVFWAFLCNRVLSGLAEAMASGADEALAYDSLVQEGDPDHWPMVLSLQMRFQALAAVISMSVGALVYDPSMMSYLAALLGWETEVGRQTSMRFPVYLTLVLAFLALLSTVRMEERQDEVEEPADAATIRHAARLILRAGRWIAATPFALAVIIFGMLYDHILRLIITLTSQYFRLIAVPEASFGVIMAAMSLLGLIVPKGAERLVEILSPAQNAAWLGLLLLATLTGLIGFFPFIGLAPMALVMVALMLTGFFTSHYLNRVTPSNKRATVLSFKGLAFNFAYGTIGILFALQINYLRQSVAAESPNLPGQLIEHEAFRRSFSWFPWYVLILLMFAVLFCAGRLKRSPPSGTSD